MSSPFLHTLRRIALLALAVGGTCGQATALHDARAMPLVALNTHADPQKTAVLQAPPSSPDDDAANRVRAALTRLQVEIKNLQAEIERIGGQSVSDQAALEAARRESRYWIAVLATLLLICLSTIAWLLWRFHAMTKKDIRTSWAELFADPDMNTVEPTQWGENTELNTAMFHTTAFNTADFHTVAPMQPSAPQDTSRLARAASSPEPLPASPDSEAATPPAPDRSRKADEISTVMELAEAWMTLHYPAKVLEILEPFSRLEQPQSPLPWLCLLDVHRMLGDREKYEAILERIKKIFNVRLAPWTVRPETERPRTLGDFPHIRERILELWEGDCVQPYLEGLLLDNRKGGRNGFDLPVYRDILRLIALARDPGRPRQRDLLTHDDAYAMLFAAPTRNTADATPEEAKRGPSSAGAGTEWCNSAFSDDNLSPMAIKLHLAVAYQDIGDKEGASLLLEEVIHGGNAEQAEQARAMRAQLG